MADIVRFIHKNGKVIPIRAPGGAGRAGHVAGKAVKVAHAATIAFGAHQIAKHGTVAPKKPIKVNRGLDAAGLGLSVASGAIAAATFSGGAKGLLGGALVSHGLDIAGIGTNVASVAGKGKTKARAAQAAKQETRNFIVGNAVYGLGVLASSRNRTAAVNYAQKIVQLGRKALRVV